MRKSTKALIFSLFVFPGAGHLLLKRYIFATIVIGISIACMTFLMVHAVTIAQVVVDKIVGGQIKADISTIRQLIRQEQSLKQTVPVNFVTGVLIITWLTAFFDTYRITRKLDNYE